MAVTPVVTCVTVTTGTTDRLPRLRASLAAYARQTWPARRLVVVLDGAAGGDAAAVRALVGEQREARLVTPPAGATLGALRNAGWDAADGDLVCQWDDDDLHHPTRIARQKAALEESGRPALALADVLHLFEAEGRLFWTNWAATPIGAHPGTLLCRRDAGIRYPEHGPEAHCGEDSAVALALRARDALATLPGAPHLYVYVAHGTNVSSIAHHRMLAQELGLSQGLLRRREAALRRDLADLELDGEVTLCGPNGAAFTLDRAAR